MRKNIVAGNWKMNTILPEGLALAKELDTALKGKAIDLIKSQCSECNTNNPIT